MNHENDNPGEISQADLLRFLDAGPKVLRWPKGAASAREPLGVSGPECPEAERYTELAAGAVEGDTAETLLAHAADCAACGDLLAWNLSALEGDPSPEEIAAIAKLAATRTDWQQKMARELAATPTLRPAVLLHPGQWRIVAAVAACLLLAAGLAVWQRQTHLPARQLAMAYEESRTLELRVPEAGYAPMTSDGRTRGALNGHEPAPLLDARAQLARALERSPQDAHLLELQARADVLEERYDAATDVFDRLLSQGPVTADLLADAASAYYQRGLVSGSELDRSTALDYLRRADELAPADPVILFNEAIVMEDRGQMMNAVEVWNRYVTVERDAKWAAEGKRKLAALEQTLSRLKSHQSRVEKMLATPQAMDELAADAPKLATLDEELSSYELDKVLLKAYPEAKIARSQDALTSVAVKSTVQESGQARGSPCTENCLAARRLLKAIASSLEIQHHDSWLADLLSPDIDSLPAAAAATYSEALQSLAHAVREDETGVPATGEEKAAKARALFEQLPAMARSNASMLTTARAGEGRASVEYMFALQRGQDFSKCRTFARGLGAEKQDSPYARYPWIVAQAAVTEKVCDSTPETRAAGRALAMSALHLSESEHYRLLTARVHLMLCGDALDSGDDETGERLVMTTLRELYAADTPPIRIANAVAALAEVEQDSPLTHRNERILRETVAWNELAGNSSPAARVHMNLARAEMRIGAMKEAENQLRLAHEESRTLGDTSGARFSETEILLAGSMLERGNLSQVSFYLDQASDGLRNTTDDWLLRPYVATRGMLELELGHFPQAASILEAYIRESEGSDVRRGDPATATEFAQLDRELYAELAAAWLAQGRSPESVLALWERFRLRSRGLPITQCAGGNLDCEESRIAAMRGSLKDNLLIGQILLLDRVLVYRVDRDGIAWTSIPRQKQDVLDAAMTLERAVSSPLTSTETAEQLGAKLSDSLLPKLPATLGPNEFLILEPDPLLRNLSWPVLPTPAGPLGLHYPLAEMRSILALTSQREENGFETGAGFSGPDLSDTSRSLVVGASIVAEGEPPLPEAIEEARSVGSFLHTPQLLLGSQANTAHVAQLLDSATVFHFAGHAVQTSQGTELLLASASFSDKRPWVDGAFLRQHPPRVCRLAVLSACATGVEESSWNHPLQDIVETLGSLGVPEVVATRWQIGSESAVPFMNDFYRSMAQGNNVAMALTLARRLQFLRPHQNNPYYWGAYYVTCTESVSRRSYPHAKK